MNGYFTDLSKICKMLVDMLKWTEMCFFYDGLKMEIFLYIVENILFIL